MTPYQEAQQFLSIKTQFQLGILPTEMQHPRTLQLAYWAQNNISEGVQSIFEVDRQMLQTLCGSISALQQLHHDIVATLQSGGRIFLCGCGATGRLSLTLETLFKQKYFFDHHLKERVLSFMAGGDVALIHSIEKFEDYPSYGERQLRELGFQNGDLLIATTEGGETPWVIGATEAASKLSFRNPYFLYCNPDDILCQHIERSRKVIQDTHIKKINLTVGPMALTGSTRMQASTILMAAVGYCLLNFDSSFSQVEKDILELNKTHSHLKIEHLKNFIECESHVYKENGYVFYSSAPSLAISILTDTTERSPTFSLAPFENQEDVERSVVNPSLSYLVLEDLDNVTEAWQALLSRNARAFYWPEVTEQTKIERLMGFDISQNVISKRRKYAHGEHAFFKVSQDSTRSSLNSQINLRLENSNWDIYFEGKNILTEHLILKMILNTHSTLVMGRLHRYESNLMTWVRPSNFKLIDRSVRYAQALLSQKEKSVDYDALVVKCFEIKARLKSNEPLVIYLVESFL